MYVSILIPCYNAEAWIGQCIESALSQTWREKEVVVVDDGSTDGSYNIIQSFGARIRYETGPNRGGNAARNRLLELSRGDWLQYLDADDYLLPDKVRQQAAFLNQARNVDVVFSRIIQESHETEIVKQAVSLMLEPLDPWCLLVRWDLPQTGGMLLRKSSVIAAGGWKIGQPCCQEHELYFRLLESGQRFGYCKDYGAVYRQWSNGSVCTKNPSEVHRRRLEIIEDSEHYLRSTKELTDERLWAINHARLEIARVVWGYNRNFALEIARRIKQSMPGFKPDGPGGRARYTAEYKLTYGLLGFRCAEALAGWARKRKK